jgi:hypothetical protein
MKRLLYIRGAGAEVAVLALLMRACSRWPRADIWGFVRKGVAHFASERLDERYELSFRGDEL